jgi:hypothetical protein
MYKEHIGKTQSPLGIMPLILEVQPRQAGSKKLRVRKVKPVESGHMSEGWTLVRRMDTCPRVDSCPRLNEIMLGCRSRVCLSGYMKFDILVSASTMFD